MGGVQNQGNPMLNAINETVIMQINPAVAHCDRGVHGSIIGRVTTIKICLSSPQSLQISIGHDSRLLPDPFTLSIHETPSISFAFTIRICKLFHFEQARR
jgi:hypothetical protein